MHAPSGKQCCGRTFLRFLFQNPPRFPQESRNAASDCSLSVSGSAGQVQVRGVTLGECVCTRSHLCWFSLSSCCLRRVGRNLLLASAASMSSISLLLSSRMAERMRRLSSRSTVPSSCAWNDKCKKQWKKKKESARLQNSQTSSTNYFCT